MKRKVLAILSSWIVLVGNVAAHAETLQEEAARRLPPVLGSLVIPEKILSGQTYTITWSLTGYHANYKSSVSLFNCTGKAQGTCGSNIAEAFANSGNLPPTSSETGAWEYDGVVSTRFNYTTTMTAPTVSGDTDIVIRFFQVNSVDEAAGKAGLSLLPGGLPAGVSFYDDSGRRLLVKALDPSGFPNNGSPKISTIATQITDANTPTSPISFSIADLQSSTKDLLISVTSSNTALVNPNGNISLTGSGENRSIKITPTTSLAGTANITVNVSDGTNVNPKTFTINVGSLLSIGDVSVTEGDSGSVSANFPVTLDKASSQVISANYATLPIGSITANADYTTTTGTLTIPAGQTSGIIAVPVLGDTLYEPNEVFQVTLSSPINVAIAVGTGNATIVDNDPIPTVAFTTASQSVNESMLVTAKLQLSAVSGMNTVVPFTVSGTATAGTDYSNVTTSPLTLAAGSSSGTITFTANSDNVTDVGETVILTLGTPTYATLGTIATHTVTIITPIVPKTGQTVSYATGDDGNLQAGVAWPGQRFTDNSDGTVTDTLTGLVWLKNAGCFSTQNWVGALTSANALAIGSCGLSDSSAAGSWRLPNRRELKSLISYDNSSPALPTNHKFTNVQTGSYWTSSTSASSTTNAWNVNITNGYVNNYAKTDSYYIWPVRGGQ